METPTQTPTESIRQLLAPYLAKVQAAIEARPELKARYSVINVSLCTQDGITCSAISFYGQVGDCLSTARPSSLEEVITQFESRLSEIPAPPTREQLIAQKRAELAALEGGQS